MANSETSAFAQFSSQLLDDPSVKVAIANRSLMPPLKHELYSVYVVMLDEIHGPNHASDPADLYFAAKRLGVSLAKAVWASQLTRRMDAGNQFDLRNFDDHELEIYLMTGLQ